MTASLPGPLVAPSPMATIPGARRAAAHARADRRPVRKAALATAPLAGLLILLVVSGLASALTFYREYKTREVERRLEDQMTLLLSDEDNRPRIPPAPPELSTGRLLLADALYLAREASRQPVGPLRQSLLARAERELRQAVATRPHWGEAWVTMAYVASLQGPAQPEVERLALIRSYADAPILPKTGYWRIERSLAHWDELPPGTRDRLVTEVAWLLRYGEIANRAALFDLARRSPAYRPIFLRWRATARDLP